ncbi:pentapeptide repeat-containing protein [Candidatus Uabimicrobium sp. HlEnr_7]|uniref:pentapeptide repeat-containing protein n=1 Tax=Candidatus Uabimicrobium helgolandensis TaxID=3095367 RepID=UPI003558D9BC
MANLKHFELILQSCKQNNCNTQWNTWRKQNPKEFIDLSSVNLSYCDLSSANLNGVLFDKSYLKDTVFTDCNLQNSSFYKSYAQNASFKHCNMAKTKIIDAHFLNICFFDTNLLGSDFTGSDLRGCRFDQVCYRKIRLQNTLVDNICLNNCQGRAAKVVNIKCSKCTIDGKYITNENAHLLLKDILLFSKQHKNLQQFFHSNAKKELIVPKKKQRQKSEKITSSSLETDISFLPTKIHAQKNEPQKEQFKSISNTSHFKKYLLLGGVFLIFAGLMSFYFRQNLFFYILSYKLHHHETKTRYKAISDLKMSSRETQSHPQVIKILISRLVEDVPEVREKVLKVLSMINRPALKYLLKVLYFGNKKQRLAALEIVEGMRDEGFAALPIVLKLLKSTDRDICIAATKVILQMGHLAGKALPLLLENLEVNDSKVRVITIRAISQMPSFSLVRPRLFKYLHSQDKNVLGEVVLAISGSHYLPSGTIPLLCERLLKEKSAHLKNRILFCLGNLSQNMDLHIPTNSIEKCLYGENPKTANYAARTLGQVKAIGVIKKLLKAKEANIRYLAVISVHSLGEQKNAIMNDFFRAMKNEENHGVLLKQLAVFSYLEKSLSNEKMLLSIMNSTNDYRVRNSCIHQLRYVAVSPEVIDMLVQIIIDDLLEKEAAKVSLGFMEKRTLPLISNIWPKAKRRVKIDLLEVLQKMSDITTITSLILPMVRDKDPQVRRSLLKALMKSKSQNITHIIEKCLQDEKISVRRLATQLFAKSQIKRSPGIHRFLMQNITHTDNKLRLYSLKALVESGYYNKEFIEHLKKDPYHQILNLIRKIERQKILNEKIR